MFQKAHCPALHMFSLRLSAPLPARTFPQLSMPKVCEAFEASVVVGVSEGYGQGLQICMQLGSTDGRFSIHVAANLNPYIAIELFEARVS